MHALRVIHHGRQINLIYIQYMFTYMLQYVSWQVDRFTVQKVEQSLNV